MKYGELTTMLARNLIDAIAAEIDLDALARFERQRHGREFCVEPDRFRTKTRLRRHEVIVQRTEIVGFHRHEVRHFKTAKLSAR